MRGGFLHLRGRARGARRALLFARLAFCLLSCAPEPEPVVRVVTDPTGTLDLDSLEVEPADAVRAATPLSSHARSVAFEPDALERGITLRTRGSCTVRVQADGSSTNRRIQLTPLFELPRHLPQVGFDRRVRIEPELRCAEAEEGSFRWSIREGNRHGLTVSVDGKAAIVRTDTAGRLLAERPGWGIVPVSAADRGTLRLRLRWTAPGRPPTDREVTVSAAARSTGLPAVPLGTALLLAGEGWHVTEAPAGPAPLTPRSIGARLSRWEADRPGRWRLEDGQGESLALSVGRFVDTPLDCGRAECHAETTRAARRDPMLQAFDPVLGGSDPRCGIGCHAVGEPGLPDGGFAEVAASHRVALDEVSHTTALPSALRRVAGVGCLGCHGPAAIPEESARWAVLRTDVCGTCHDAPPRYGHVSAWRSSPMATADRDPRTRNPGCRSCHTTAGFLHATGAGPPNRLPPPEVGPVGITCVACHAPHDPDAAGPLLRRVPIPEALASVNVDRKSAACVSCHASTSPNGPSSALFAFGRGGVDARGRPLEGDAPHASLACVDCHRESPAGVQPLSRGATHGFVAPADGCERCHGDDEVERHVRQRGILASSVAAASQALAVTGTHADGTVEDVSPAVHDLLRLRNDAGAWAHAPDYALRLLEVVRGAISDGSR